MQKTFLLYLSLVLVATLHATVPSGYYNSAEGKTGAALKASLATIVSANYNDVGYDGLYDVYKTSDVLPNGKIWDMYSVKADGTASYYYSTTSGQCGTYNSEGDCYNREHTFCDSWLGEASPQRSDAHHLIPTDGYVNNRRGSFPHGKVGSVSWTSTNGSKLGSSDASTGYSGTVFEPIDAYKGDFARMYFYVATRYESKIASWVNNGTADEILAGNAYPAYKTWFINLMLAWHRLDPVSQKEIDRNDVIYGYQNNRNPYIDFPNLAEYVWGTSVGQPWSQTNTNSPYLTSPANGIATEFGNVAYQYTKKLNVLVKGANLTGSISLSLTGTNANLFSLNVSSVSKTDAEAGYNVEITYSANTLGAHTANLQLSGGGITAYSVALTATATDAFMALAATNVSSTGFTANWTSSAYAVNGYKLEVFSKATTGGGVSTNLLDEDFTSGIPSTWSSVPYVVAESSTYVRIASSGNSGSLITPELNMSVQTNLSVKAKQYNNDTGATLTATVDGNALTSWNTTSTVETYTATIPVKTSTSKITFSAAKGARVMVDRVTVSTLGGTVTEVPVSGYPVTTANVLSYNVSGLLPDSTYYYRVSLVDNASTVSESVSVKTLLLAGENTVGKQALNWYKNQTGIVISGLAAGVSVEVINMQGTRVASLLTKTNSENVKLKEHGAYIIKTSEGARVKVLF